MLFSTVCTIFQAVIKLRVFIYVCFDDREMEVELAGKVMQIAMTFKFNNFENKIEPVKTIENFIDDFHNIKSYSIFK